MDDTTKGLIAGAGLTLLVAAGAWYLTDRLGGGGDDQWPPIIITEGSIHFGHGYGWADQSGDEKRWRPDHPTGRHTEQFVVDVTSNNSDANCGRMRGKDITITYGNHTFTLNPRRHGGGNKDEPELESSVALQPDASGLVLALTDDGKITTVKVGNHAPCDVSQKPKIRIKVEPKHQ